MAGNRSHAPGQARAGGKKTNRKLDANGAGNGGNTVSTQIGAQKQTGSQPKLYRDAPEAKEASASGERTVHIFMEQVLPKASKAARALAANLITTTLSTVGKRFSESRHTRAEIEAYAGAMADMFCAYLRGIQRG